MFASVIFALASGAALQHGTDAQCADWYPDDWRMQLECSEIVDPVVLAEMSRYRSICKQLATVTRNSGLAFVSASLKDGPKTVSCDGDFEKPDPEELKIGG